MSKVSIGIVVPFEDMVDKYESVFNERLLRKFDISRIKVGPPSAFRGHEKDILIISSFRNSAD